LGPVCSDHRGPRSPLVARCPTRSRCHPSCVLGFGFYGISGHLMTNFTISNAAPPPRKKTGPLLLMISRGLIVDFLNLYYLHSGNISSDDVVKRGCRRVRPLLNHGINDVV